jgi:predicted ArsR family transcriptional regulator
VERTAVYVKQMLILEDSRVTVKAMTTPGGGTPSSTEADLVALSALAEPTRRAVYSFVASTGEWTGRDSTATALGLERATAAHHLDRLAADGLLDVTFERLSARRGPGAGRTAKLYRRADRTFELSLPPRDYELAGQLLAAAADTATTDHVEVDAALDEAARREGRRMAQRVRERAHAADSETVRASMVAVLREHGYEPCTADDGTVVLRNCPFHRLAQAHTQLVCGMNLSLLDELSGNVAEASLAAALEPSDDACCVRLHPAG